MLTTLSEKQLLILEEKANAIRQLIVEMLLEAKSGHSAGPLGMADIFSAFYFYILNHDPKNPSWEDRDRLVLSNGHICPVLYATLALSGYFSEKEALTLRKFGSRLQGHPHRTALPGLETTSGPLGEGLSQAVGMALASRLDKKRSHIYCITSDGEHEEGNTWEAIMFAGKEKLHNLTVVIDRNNIQIDGYTEDIMPLEPMREKYEAFGWHVIDVNGNNIRDFIMSIGEAQTIYEKPTVIIAHTIPGKGVSFMEADYHWHGTPPNKEQAVKALKELRTFQGELENEYVK